MVSEINSCLKTPVAVLLGGQSAEREISLQSGKAVMAALSAQNISAVAIDTADEQWLAKVAENYQHVFIALHGGEGEDGTVQGALENIGVTYTGSGVEASAMAMNKMSCKYLWQGIDLPTPKFAELTADTNWPGVIDEWQKVIVKPAHEGSSIGMSIATTAEELKNAFAQACQFDQAVLAEQWVSGREFTVAILGDQPLPAIELVTDHSFYDYDAKYLADDTQYLCPCDLTLEKQQELQQLALQAFKSVGCQGWGRVDVMQDQQGNFYLLEVNTVPGMTDHSLVPMAAKAAGKNFADLVTEILWLSLRKKANESVEG